MATAKIGGPSIPANSIVAAVLKFIGNYQGDELTTETMLTRALGRTPTQADYTALAAQAQNKPIRDYWRQGPPEPGFGRQKGNYDKRRKLWSGSPACTAYRQAEEDEKYVVATLLPNLRERKEKAALAMIEEEGFGLTPTPDHVSEHSLT